MQKQKRSLFSLIQDHFSLIQYHRKKASHGYGMGTNPILWLSSHDQISQKKKDNENYLTKNRDLDTVFRNS